MHLCGRNVHLHDALRELKISMLHGYGAANRPEEMMKLAGKVILQGNIDPMILYRGNRTEVEDAVGEVLATLAPSRGIILGDGYNIVPGTSLANLGILREVSREYGPPGRN